MSDNEMRRMDAALGSILKGGPEQRVPDGFSRRVMGSLEPKRPSAWLRFKLWLFGPMSLTFTPMQVAPVAVCTVALLILGFMHFNQSVIPEGPQLSTVRFALSDASRSATTVSVIGSFNDWDTERSVMWYDEGDKKWILEAMLPPGDHEYVFVVDGHKLVPDPQAQMSRDDGFGNKNSILFVPGSHEQAL